MQKHLNYLLDNISNTRDGVLIGVSVLYFLGFVSWAFFAWAAQLGTAPALQAQYFVSGLPLLFIIGATVFVTIGLQRWLFDIWPGWLERRGRRIQISLLIVLSVLTLGAALLQYAIPEFNFTLTHRPLWLATAIGAVLILGLLMLAHPLGAEGFERAGYTFALYGLMVIAAFVPFTYATLLLYPHVPQQFGGGKPRCATLDLFADRFSQETLVELALNPTKAAGVVRSKEVYIIFSSGEAMYVFIPVSQKNYLRYEMNRGDVSAIMWCAAFSSAQQP